MAEEDNVIYIGSKPVLSYVLAVLTQFEQEGRDEVIIKARGQTVATAVDVAEFTIQRFLDEAEIRDVSIGTDEVADDDGDMMRLSSIEIVLAQ